MPHAPWLRWLLLAVFLASTAGGCVQRRFTVRTNPPGALVVVDDTYEVGVTPVAFSYTYYGTRKLTISKPGYETLTIYQHIPAPWYEVFPLDFVAENVVPWEIRDERSVEYTLRPQVIVPREQLLQRAENLRQQAQQRSMPVPGAAAAAPLPTPPGPPPLRPPGPAPGSSVQPLPPLLGPRQ
jgi:hypothetical protein